MFPNQVAVPITLDGITVPLVALQVSTGDHHTCALLLTRDAPTENDGTPVTSFTATIEPGGATCTSGSLSCVVDELTPATDYPVTVTVTAANTIGSGIASTPPFSFTTLPDIPDIVPLAPSRFYETRNDPLQTTFDGLQQGTGQRAAGQKTVINIEGRNNIPADAAGTSADGLGPVR